MDQDLGIDTEGKGYGLSGKIMLSAIVVAFAVVVIMVGLHLYARWYLLRLRGHQLERRRQWRGGRTHIVFYAENHHSSSVLDRGLEAGVLNSLPVFLYSSKAEQPMLECAVCLSEFEENEVARLLPKCNHSFHIECIDMWFHSHSTCPLCRSLVEPVVNRDEPVAIGDTTADEVSGSETGSSSGSGLCATCQHEGNGNTMPSEGRRKAMGGLAAVRIEVPPPRRAELESELTQSSPTGQVFRSPGTRLLSLKRLLSMTKKSPVGGGGGATPHAAGTSRWPAELDLECGRSEPVRVQTPR